MKPAPGDFVAGMTSNVMDSEGFQGMAYTGFITSNPSKTKDQGYTTTTALDATK
jgi:hypothetical protein